MKSRTEARTKVCTAALCALRLGGCCIFPTTNITIVIVGLSGTVAADNLKQNRSSIDRSSGNSPNGGDVACHDGLRVLARPNSVMHSSMARERASFHAYCDATA